MSGVALLHHSYGPYHAARASSFPGFALRMQYRARPPLLTPPRQ